MGYFKIIDKGEGPKRLFVGGVHGREGATTIKALSQVRESDVQTGKLLIYNCERSPYISTLDERYYKSEIGKEVLSIINHHKPSVYVEPHCYKPESYKKLVAKDRKERVGVPPLIELEEGVLIGSVSPFIRTTHFKREDICITLEMPCSPSKRSLDVYVSVLRAVARSNNRSELEEKLKVNYPHQIKTARRYAREFFGDYPPF